MTDHQIIFLKLWVNKLAVICGKVSREMASTIPTMRRHDTMVSAMNIIRIYSNKATGIRWERANSRSKAMQMIGFRNKVKNSISSTERMASSSSPRWLRGESREEAGAMKIQLAVSYHSLFLYFNCLYLSDCQFTKVIIILLL